VHTILNNLKDEVAALQDEIEAQGTTYFAKHAAELVDVFDGTTSLGETLAVACTALGQRNGDSIPTTCPDLRATHEDADIQRMIRHIGHVVTEAKMTYHNFALAAREIVTDAEKMDIVVKACQTEFIKMKLTTNNAKARLNAHRVGWTRMGYAFRQWAEMVHFATIECIQQEMDEFEQEAAAWRAESDAAIAKARAEFEKQLGGQRRTKMELMLRKMKNSRLTCAFSTWSDWLAAIKWAAYDAERQCLLEEYQKRFAHLSAEEIERKLRQFMQRWINRKMLAPWKTWKDLMAAKKLAAMQGDLEADLAAMRARLAAMADNAALQKLKTFFAMKLGKMKGVVWKALVVNANQEKAIRLLESEAGARLKKFLQNKLAGLGRKCWQAWLRHHDNIAAENIKNNENAKKVAIMLEKIARGLVHRLFGAFVRHFKAGQEDRAALDAINARLAMMDELNKAKLRVFLDAKRLGKMSTFFKWWADVTRNSALYALQDQIAAEDAFIKDLKAKIGDAEAQLGGKAAAQGSLAHDLKSLIAAAEDEEEHCAQLESQLNSLMRKIEEVEDLIADERAARGENVSELRNLERELDALHAQRDALAAELAGIAGEVGYVHKDSQF